MQSELGESHETSRVRFIAPLAITRKGEYSKTTCTNNNIDFLEESSCPEENEFSLNHTDASIYGINQ